MLELDINGTPVLYGLMESHVAMSDVLERVIKKKIKKVFLLSPLKSANPVWVTYVVEALVERKVQLVIRENNTVAGGMSNHQIQAKKIASILVDGEVKFALVDACAKLVDLGEFANDKDVLVIAGGVDNLLAAMKALGVGYVGLEADAANLDYYVFGESFRRVVSLRMRAFISNLEKLGSPTDSNLSASEHELAQTKLYQRFVDFAHMMQQG